MKEIHAANGKLLNPIGLFNTFLAEVGFGFDLRQLGFALLLLEVVFVDLRSRAHSDQMMYFVEERILLLPVAVADWLQQRR